MGSLTVRLAAAAVAFAALTPVSAAHAAPTALEDVPLPFLWPRAGVTSVDAVSDTEAWVSGVQGQIGDSRGNPVVRHRVGSRWKEYPINGWTGNGGIRQVVEHDGEVWAWGVQEGENLYLARFDGTAFEPVAPPPGLAYVHHTRLWSGPAGVWLQIWVNPRENVLEPELFRRVGDTWQRDPVARDLQDGVADIQATSASEAWAGGCRFNPATGKLDSLTFHWNGSTWSDLPPLPTTQCVRGVTPAPGGAVWALTWDTLYRWNGTTWTEIPDDLLTGYAEKVRLDGDGNPIVLIDKAPIYGDAPLLRYADGTWQTFTTPVRTWPGDVSVAPTGRIWVTGSTRIYSPLLLRSP